MRIFLSAEMENKASTPLHYTRKYVEDRLQFICKEGVGLEEDDTYGTEFKDIGIIVIILPQQYIDNGWKERRLVKRKTKEADIRLYIDYERFLVESREMQRLMYVKAIIDSIEVVKSRSKGDFKGDKLIEDILKALDLTKEDFKKLEKKN